MQPFTTVTGPAAPLLRPNIDTDVIIRVERLVGTAKAEMGAHAFEIWRRRPDGSEDPDFVLNRAPYRDAPILLAGSNFGCGSSREGAVWALAGAGVRAVIAPSFSDIFANNALQNGLLPVVLPEASVSAIAAEVERSPGNARVTVDLERCVVVSPSGDEHPFAVDAARREALLAGLDDIGLTLRQADAIAAWQTEDRSRRPWAWPT
ncbi:3-isopropylmalate dehydratase small subunit [Elioraea rosea]|uniref:3-isopropylmalate dehydratase small subunit n=1 Tax=Elioraea rosea TaxID=2492390 RepID=UPI001183C098|nr:3-isopropylmalate dehydratase small subunit [Elioraea rosea]